MFPIFGGENWEDAFSGRRSLKIQHLPWALLCFCQKILFFCCLSLLSEILSVPVFLNLKFSFLGYRAHPVRSFFFFSFFHFEQKHLICRPLSTPFLLWPRHSIRNETNQLSSTGNLWTARDVRKNQGRSPKKLLLDPKKSAWRKFEYENGKTIGSLFSKTRKRQRPVRFGTWPFLSGREMVSSLQFSFLLLLSHRENVDKLWNCPVSQKLRQNLPNFVGDFSNVLYSPTNVVILRSLHNFRPKKTNDFHYQILDPQNYIFLRHSVNWSVG